MFLGLPTFTQNFNTNDYAKVGDYGISQGEYFRTRSMIEENIREQFGQQIDLTPLNEFIDQQAKSSLIEKYTLVKFFDELGITIPHSYLENELAKNEVFQVDGKFNQEAFKNYLINFNLSKEDLVGDFEADLKLNLSVALLNSTVNIYDNTLDQYLDLLTERRSLKFFELTKDNVTKDFEISEDEINEFYQQNINKYLIPEKRSFVTVEFSKENLNIEISQEELTEAYNSYLQTLPSGEKRISHLMVIGENYTSTEEFTNRVNQIGSELTSENFEEYVIANSEDEGTADLGGDLGFTDGQIFPLEFEEVILTLGEGELSQSIFYEGNAHFLKVTEIDQPVIESFEDKTQSLKNELIAIKFEDVSNSLVESLVGSTESVLSIEEKYNVPSIAFTDVSYGANDFSSSDESIIFKSDLNRWSEPFEVTSSSFKIANTFASEPQATEELENVIDEVTEGILNSRKADYLEQIYASELGMNADLLKGQFSINNFKVEEFKNINRTTSLLSNEIVNLVFSEPEIGVVKKQLLGDKLFVFSILARIPGDNTSVPEDDLEAIESESRTSKLQTTFNKLRLEYNLDEKYAVNSVIANQTS